MAIDDHEVQNVTRHPTLYFADGNIVLSALSAPHSKLSCAVNIIPEASNLSTPNTLLFRVHKSLLQENSVVFRDMLELGEASSELDEKYDGVPMVQMPDTAEEVEDILKVFYRPWDIWLRKYHPDTCLQVKNILAMAIKYQFTEIKQRILAHIEADWPKTLTEWDWFEDYMKSLPSSPDDERACPEPASTAVLACRYGIRRVLPAVFYELSRTDPSEDWEDILNEIGPVDGRIYVPQGSGRVARWSLLDGDHFRIMLRGRRCMEMVIKQTLTPLKTQGACRYCIKEREMIVEKLCTMSCTDERDPLNALRLALMESNILCATCEDYFKTKLAELRAEIWKRLPEFFQLGGRDSQADSSESEPGISLSVS
ncbi:hypothetical protein M0805_001858 [Coniferiporia weirii]|nr:hypothetical protein M0805_001858 [Coniferiporia weirii]